MTLEDGKEFLIKAPENSNKNVFVENLMLNGVERTKTWIDHFDILQGGTLHFEMAEQPNQAWGSGVDDAPYSMTGN